jgi:hypothetical protein
MEFREPLVIEPTVCRMAAKIRKIKISGKEHPFKMNVRTLFSVNG